MCENGVQNDDLKEREKVIAVREKTKALDQPEMETSDPTDSFDGQSQVAVMSRHGTVPHQSHLDACGTRVTLVSEHNQMILATPVPDGQTARHGQVERPKSHSLLLRLVSTPLEWPRVSVASRCAQSSPIDMCMCVCLCE